MGHRTYLSVDSNDHETIVFEVNNCVPFFWVGLLSQDILEFSHERWQHYQTIMSSNDEQAIERYTDILPSPSRLIIERHEFEQNSQDMQLYLQKYYPFAVSLYNDFQNYIHAKLLDEDDYISLDIIELSHFSSVEILYDELLKTVIDIKELRKPNTHYLARSEIISNGCGFACDGFDLFSTAYQESNLSKNSQPKKRITNVSDPRKSLYKHSCILLMSLVLSYIVYRRFLSDGLSYLVLFLLFINVCLYQYSAQRIYEIIKTGKNK